MGLEFMKVQILAIGMLILGAYAVGVLAKKLNIGETIGQIIGGMLIGPHFWFLVHEWVVKNEFVRSASFFNKMEELYSHGFESYSLVIEESHFFVFFFLGVIAFSLGEELHFDRLKKVGIKATVICGGQALLTWLSLSLVFWKVFHFTAINSLVVGSIGIATAPALTFVLMNKLKVEGKLKNLLANIVVLDDIIEVVFFSVFLGIAVMTMEGESLSIGHLAYEVVRELVFAFFIGWLIFILLKFTVKPGKVKSEEGLEVDVESFYGPMPSIELFFIVVGFVAVGSAAALHFHVPFLVTAVVAGALVSNYHFHAIFHSLQLSNIMPALNLFFFALIGASVKLETFSKETFIYVAGYLIVRGSAKFIGTWIGCYATKQEKEITNSLPKLMLPQAGMAAVETILVATVLKGHGGEMIFNTIIPALVIFEIGGAWLSERTLLKWKEYIKSIRSTSEKRSDHFSIEEILTGNVVELEAGNKEEAINNLAELIGKKGVVKDIHEVAHAIMAREKLASTSLGKGVAIPHCRTDEVSKTVCVCGLIKNPVEWDSPDGKPVDIVFLVITPKEKPQEYLKVVRSIITTIKKLDLDGRVNHDLLRNILLA
ncbi:PTS sugar transporter subunit IIA [uncultured Ilyobacter sp.]|uniref:PTS sugar transporter subunit IIA n=1 Tax=uncultured Ilyobacter sp. TaxID=544433 RepID=UPI0029C0E11D|nr:PTS sugar transporter subunit IIA [uncultured Ilyobacter sp.]